MKLVRFREPFIVNIYSWSDLTNKNTPTPELNKETILLNLDIALFYDYIQGF